MVKKGLIFVSIRRFVLTLPALVLVLVLLAGVFPGGAAFAEEGGDPLALRFVCDETVASVTVYDPAGLPLPVGADGIHHLTPGTYFYSATAEGYESTGLQAFTIPADAAGDQELRISLTPVPGSVPPGASTPGETAPDASVPGQTPVNVPDPNAPEENPEDDGKLRIRPVDGSLTLTIERETRAESAVPPEVQRLLEGKQKPLLTPDGKPVEKKLYLKTPDAEELYLDRLAVEKEIGYYTTDWTVLNLTDEEGDRKNLLPASGWYDVTVSGPATEQYRDYEPVFALVTLHWDEEGDIVDRDVQILETTHTPTKSSWSFSTDTLSTLVIAVPTDQAVIDETAKKPALTERTLVSGDGKVEVSGLLPEDAQLVVVEIPLSFAAELYSIRTGEAKAEEEILFAYDISILSGGEKFQPEDFGESVRVRIGGLNTGDGVSDVLHLKAGAVNQAGDLDLSSVGAAGSAESELLPASAEGDTVLFETDGFSVFVGASASAPAVRAASVIQDGDYEIDFDSGTITKCTAKGEVVIPTEIAGVTVRRIGKRAFTGPSTTSISVTIPEGVSISSEAFHGCIGLRSVTLPENLSVIPDDAFYGCENLVSVTIPKNVRTISTSAFSRCKRLQNVTFEDGSKLSEIGHCVFEFCASLPSVTIPDGVYRIGNGAYADCTSLQSVTLPSSVESLGESTFDDCDALKEIWYYGSPTQWEALNPANAIGNYANRIANGSLVVHCLMSLSVNSSPTAGGTVSVSPDPNAPGPSEGKYWSSTSVTATAMPNSGYFFVNWTENGSVVTGTDGNPVGATYTFTATTDRDLVANFARPAPVTGEVKVKKTLTGRAWTEEDSFEFTITPNGSEPAFTQNTITITKNDTNYTKSFGEITFTEAGTYYYTVAETHRGETIDGVAYDRYYHRYPFIIENESGQLVAREGSPLVKTLQFTNTYSASGTGEIQVEKILTGRDWKDGDSFEFTLSAGTGTPMPPANTLTITNTDTDHTKSFGEIEFTQAGTYTYTVTETKGALDGVSYDTTAHTVTITLEDDGKGNLVAPSGSTLKQTEKFTNTFTPAKATLEVTKSLNSWRAGDSFTFELAPVNGAPMPANSTTVPATTTATENNSTASFGEITYNSVGTYKYTITEEDGGLPGVSYDRALHEVIVTVSKAPTTNVLTAAVEYDGADSLIVTNIYSVDNLTVSKTVVSDNAVDKQRAFDFTVILDPDTINGTYGDMTFLNGVATFKLKDGEAKTAYSLPSGIRYTVTEETAAGFTTTKTGNIGTIGQETKAEFTNSLTPAAAPTLTAKPQDLNLTYGYTTGSTLGVTAAAATDADYNLSYQWYSNTTASNTGGTPIPGATSSSYTVPTGKTAGTTEYYYCAVTAARTDNGQTATAESAVATVTVGKAPLTITAKDQTYIYNGQTQGEGDTAYEDPAEIAEKVTVVGLQGNDTVTSVTIDGQGKEVGTYDLIPSGAAIGLNGNKTANYAISYVKGKLTILPPAVAEINVTKVLEGRNWKDGDSFTFELAAVNGAPMPASSTATAKKDEPTASFGEVTYYSVGPFEYTITESKGSLDGVTYDTAPHTVLVTVTQADPTAAPTAEVKYDGAASLTVKNTFTPATAPTITGPENLTLTYGYTTDNKLSVTATPATDGTYDLGYQWYSCEDTVKTNPQKIDLATEASYAIPTGKSAETTEYYYCEVTATRTDNGQTATASSAVATVTINRVPAPTSLTDAQKPTPTAPTADGTPQALVIPPQELPTGYTGVKYSIDGGTNWTELNVIQTAIVPDTYVVQVLYVPDGNHTAFEGTPVKAVILPNYYVVEAESTSAWMKGSRDDAVIKVRLRGLSGKDDNSFQHFKSVAIDGAGLSEDSSALIQKDYKAEEGSTVITLHKKMLNRLSAGPHTVTITFDNGEVEAPLTILVPPGGYSPATGDSARIGFWAALMVLAGLGFAGADYARRKFRRPRYVGKH